VLETLLLTVGTVAALMGAMAVGVLFQNKPLKGSCGGQGTDCACEAAGDPGACKTGGVAPGTVRLAPEAERVVRDYSPPSRLISLDRLR